MHRTAVVGLVTATAMSLSACASRDKPTASSPTAAAPASAPPTERVVGPLTPADAQALATMNERLREYIDLHNKLARSLPALPNNASPEQIDKHQRALEQLVRDARATAKPGDIFTAEARPVIRRLLATAFSGAEGKQAKSSIMDENPVGLKLGVNRRYPDSVPLATIPPQVLQTLPKLTDDLEYRFIGNRLILLNTEANIVVDFLEDALPK